MKSEFFNFENHFTGWNSFKTPPITERASQQVTNKDKGITEFRSNSISSHVVRI